MRISYNWLKEYVKNLPKPEKLADLLTMHSFETRVIDKNILNIEVLPNRAHDCLSHIGVAREVAAIIGGKIRTTKYELREINQKTGDFVKVEVRDSELCPRYTARVIIDIKVGPSPKWIRERLEAVGQQSINNIVDATNYVALEMGQPLHVFDAERLDGGIVVRRAKKDEKIITLDGERCELDNNILVIADNKDPLAIAGIKGGKKAEITSKTKTIILESANFDQRNIHKTSRKLGIATESSLRFEHGLDPNLASEAMNRLAGLIQQIAGGKIAKGMADKYPEKLRPKKILVKLSKINSLLGTTISEKEVIKIFKLLGFGVNKKGDGLLVEIPTRRLDLEIPEDLIEEVGRIYGYDRILSKSPIGILTPVEPSDALKLRSKVKDILEGMGLTEVYNYSFIGEKDLEKIGADPEKYIELENPSSLDLKYLRKDLIINLLKNIKENLKYFNKIKLFELGTIYLKSAFQEKVMLAGAIGQKSNSKELFYELKGIIDVFLNKLGISEHWYDDFRATPEYTEKTIWHSGRSAEIKTDSHEIGYLGEINPEILAKFKIKKSLAVFNIDFEYLMKLTSEELIYQHPLKYPAVVRDIAILVNLGDRVVDVLNVINSVGGELIQDVDLFDMYEGRELPEGKKNLAFHIIYQAPNKTLTDREVDTIHQKIISEVNKKEGWDVRK